MDIVIFQRHQLPRETYSMGKHKAMRFDEGRKRCIIAATKMKARTVVGRGEESLVSDTGSE